MSLPLEGWMYSGGTLRNKEGAVVVDVDEELNAALCDSMSRVGEMTAPPVVSGGSVRLFFDGGAVEFVIVDPNYTEEVVKITPEVQAALSAAIGKSVSLVNTISFMKIIRKLVLTYGRK